MCGHVGIAGKLDHKDESTLRKLLIFDVFRGPDSTGLAALRNDGNIKIAKVASNPLDLFEMKKFTEALSGYNSTVFLGHNRLATKGKVTGANAHPYQYGHIVGAHNGTLDSASWKRLEEALGTTTDVDSQAIFACFEKIGVEETIKLMTTGHTSSDGAWALVWIDLNSNTLNFLRNKHRPFWYAYTKEFDRVFWASEWWMIDAATKSSSVTYELYVDKEGYRFFQSKEDWWYRFDLDKLKKGAAERPKPRIKEIKGREPIVASYRSGNMDPFQRGYPETWNGQTTTSRGSSSNTGSTNKSPPEIKHMVGNAAHPMSEYMDENTFNHIAKYGCSWCQKDIEYGDIGVTVYERQEMILCAECSGNEDSNRIYIDMDKLVANA